MRSIGTILAVLGFGSAILELTGVNYSFALLVFFEDYQPVAGFIIGLIGVGLIALAMRSDKAKAAEVVDPPYGRPDVNNPTAGDPQRYNQPAPGDTRQPDGPQNYRNPDIDNQAPGNTPGTYPPAGPPRE